jgi:hypothetical protein
VSWQSRFEPPVILPDGTELVTLADARAHILALPAAQHKTEAWQTAVKTLLEAAEGRGPMMHARVGVSLAINGPRPIPESRPSKEIHWHKRRSRR